MLKDARWRQVSWRRGTKGRLAARFAAARVRIADGAPHRIGSAGAQHMPGEEAWLVGEHRSNGKYYLSNLRQHSDPGIGWLEQGASDLRTVSSAAQGRTRPRSLRGAVLDGCIATHS